MTNQLYKREKNPEFLLTPEEISIIQGTKDSVKYVFSEICIHKQEQDTIVKEKQKKNNKEFMNIKHVNARMKEMPIIGFL
jgi:hypothetical protein